MVLPPRVEVAFFKAEFGGLDRGIERGKAYTTVCRWVLSISELMYWYYEEVRL